MLIVVNPAAAGGRLGREWTRLEPRLRSVGLDAPYVLTERPGHATELAAAAVERGETIVVAAGGDGTTTEVAEGLRRAGGGTLGILPLGTGNDAAAAVGVPRSPVDAARALLAGGRRRVDLLQVDDRIVLNAVGIGLLGDINTRAASFKLARGMSAYVAAALTSLFRYRPPRLELHDGTRTWTGRMTILAVQNGPTTGGGFRLTPGAQPDDGAFDACLVPGMSCLERIPRLVAALRGTLGDSTGSLTMLCERLELSFDEPLPTHLDGNPWVLRPPRAVVCVLAGALEVAGVPAVRAIPAAA